MKSIDKYLVEYLGDGFYRLTKPDGTIYTVNIDFETCSCEDYKYRTQKGVCKHILYLKEYLKGFMGDDMKEKQNEKHDIIQEADENTIEVFDQQNSYIILERRDETQILEEFKGNVIEEYVYDFDVGGRHVTGLSYAGVKAIALKMGGIHVDEPILVDYGSYWLCKVKAKDMQRDMEMWGVATQPKKIQLRNGNEINDDFCIQKVVSKAERNALRKLFPETLVIEMINEWRRNKGKLKT